MNDGYSIVALLADAAFFGYSALLIAWVIKMRETWEPIGPLIAFRMMGRISLILYTLIAVAISILMIIKRPELGAAATLGMVLALAAGIGIHYTPGRRAPKETSNLFRVEFGRMALAMVKVLVGIVIMCALIAYARSVGGLADTF